MICLQELAPDGSRRRRHSLGLLLCLVLLVDLLQVAAHLLSKLELGHGGDIDLEPNYPHWTGLHVCGVKSQLNLVLRAVDDLDIT